ncbi:MAG: TonB-dependent siderophore receptor [Verrucomicrobiota bacterium JB022]|nr:TonB-dependent siderophore receptor [Verrucomicrobiota bacterium JB022]
MKDTSSVPVSSTSTSLRSTDALQPSLGASLLASPDGLTHAYRAPRNAALLGSLVMAGASLHGQATSNEATNGDNPIDLPPERVQDDQVQLKSPKFTLPLRDVPQMVNVIPAEVFEQQQATSLRDVLRNSPGITFQAGEGGSAPGDNLFIRGFSASNDIFVNGFRNSAQYSRDSYNLEQVEVAKGPSSAIGGRGTTGGSVNLVTKSPYQRDGYNGSASFGSADQKRFTFDANQVVDAEKGIAVRLNTMWHEGGVPGRDAVQNEGWGIAPSIAFGLGERTEAVVSYEHAEQDNIPDFGQPGALASGSDVPRSNFYGLVNRDYEKIESDVVSGEIRHNFGEGLTLRNLSQYSKTSRDAVVTSPRFVDNDASTGLVRRNDVKQQDREFEMLGNQTNVTWDFATGSVVHTLVSGLELTREEYTNYGRSHDATLQPTDVYNPDPYEPWEGTTGRNGSVVKGTGDTIALYAFDTLKLTDHWSVTGGLRWENFDAEVENSDPTVDDLQREDDMVSWRAALLYKPVTSVTLYGGASTSFNPAGESLTLSTGGGRGGTAANNPNIEPEETRTYEVGAKWEPAGKGFMTGVSLFRTEKTNARTRLDNDEPYTLSGEQIVQGIELSVSGSLTEKWSVYGGYAFMDTDVKESRNTEEEGHELAYAPEHSFSLWTTYQIDPKLQVGLGAQYSGNYYYSTTAGDDTVPDNTEYWLFNAMVSYSVTENIALRFNIENLGNEEYIERGYGGHFTPGETRNYTLTASFSY